MINVKTAVLGMVAVVGLLGGCQTHDYSIGWQSNGMPRHHNPHQQWWSYQFVYFPGQQVYFEPYTDTYFWYLNGLWEEGVELPPTIILDDNTAKVVHLQHTKPYVQHQTVARWHPNFYGPLPGSMDSYHASPEAIAQSEQRSAIRVADSMDELIDMSSELDVPLGVDLTNEEPMFHPDDVFTSVDPSSDSNQ